MTPFSRPGHRGPRVRVRWLSLALLMSTGVALVGCSETADNADGDPADEVAGATTGQTEESPGESPPGGSSGGDSGGDGTEPTPVNADDGESWIYPDGFEIAITDVQAYDGGDGLYLGFEYPMKLAFELVNASPDQVHLVWAPVGECTEGNLVESLDETLPAPPDTVEAGATVTFETGFGVDEEEAGGQCQLRVKPSPDHDWAAIDFTAPQP